LEAKYELVISASGSQVKPITRCIRPNKVKQESKRPSESRCWLKGKRCIFEWWYWVLPAGV